MHLELRDWKTHDPSFFLNFIVFHPTHMPVLNCLTDKAHGTRLLKTLQETLLHIVSHINVHRLIKSFDLGNTFLSKPTDFVPLLIYENSILKQTEDQLLILHDASKSRLTLSLCVFTLCQFELLNLHRIRQLAAEGFLLANKKELSSLIFTFMTCQSIKP